MIMVKKDIPNVDLTAGQIIEASARYNPTTKQIHTKSKTRQRKLKTNHIYNENCLATMAKMPAGYVDMVLTSPPYDDMREYDGNVFTEFTQIAQELFRVVKTGGVVVWVIGDQTKNGNESGTSFKHALYFKKIGFKLFDTIIYAKPPRGAVGSNKGYWQTFEYMFVLAKGEPETINLLMDRENKDARAGDKGTKRLHDGSLLKLKRGGYSKTGRRTNIWQYNIGNGHSASDKLAKNHPAVFPEKLAEDHIISWSNKGELVYDPFIGSGTTAKMAVIQDRNYIGSELVKEYCKTAKNRVQLAVNDKESQIQGL